jgi:hypothetical protein
MLKPMITKVIGDSKCKLITENADENPSELTSNLVSEYGIKSVPAFFFMNNNQVINTHFGAISMPDLKKKVTELENYVG